MTELQIRLLDMLQWFDGYCRDNNLRYYVLGGTMLGAARHKGFIPWDDDIDVGLPRKDYETLSELMKGLQFEKYEIETVFSNDKAFCYPYSKIYDTETTLVENTGKYLRRGIFLDIFPLDGAGNNEQECKKNYSPIRRKYNFYLSRVCAFKANRTWYKNLAIETAKLIPECLINNRTLRIKLDSMCKSRDFDKEKWVANYFGNWGFREVMPKRIFGNPTEYQFENLKVFGPEQYDEYLTHVYGNWKQLPPKEKRVTHHDFKEYNLSKSYKK